MPNYLIEEETLTDIANAIREQTGTEDLIKSGDMSNMIRSIEGRGGASDTVRYNTVQSLTDEQKAQARANIGISKVVETVNGIAPDENGNVEISVDAGDVPTKVSELENDMSFMPIVMQSGEPDDKDVLWIDIDDEASGEGTAGNVCVYIGPEKPTNGAIYWLDTSEDAPVISEATLISISVTYSGGDVTVGTIVDDLTGIEVIATYSDGNTEIVTDYTLAGEIVEGSNTITATYDGMTATFTVVGIAESGGEEPDTPDIPESNIYKLADIATEVTEGATAKGSPNSIYTRYKIENIKTGDIVRLSSYNGDSTDAMFDGGTSYGFNDTTKFTKQFMDNYAWLQYTWVADQDYMYLYFASNNKIEAEGAGREPIIEKVGASEDEPSSYTITNTLTNVINSNAATTVDKNASYIASLTAADGYELKTVTVKMGGVNVTADVYNDGVVNITNVLGNIVITATAIVPEVDWSDDNVFAIAFSEKDAEYQLKMSDDESTNPAYNDFMNLSVEKIYLCAEIPDQYKKYTELRFYFTPDYSFYKYGGGVMKLDDIIAGTYDVITNAWDKFSDSGYIVFEYDVAKVKAAIQAAYDDGTLDATKGKGIIFRNFVKAGGRLALLYNYNG